MDVVYLDNNASTACDLRVVEAMNRHHLEFYANPSSSHRFGQAAHEAVDRAAGQLAALVGCDERELVFTSGGTESINLALRGVMAGAKARGQNHIVTSTVEHQAVRECLAQLVRGGCRVTEVRVDSNGALDLDQLADSLTHETALVTLMAANNETGVLTDIDAVGRLVAKAGVPLHLDATQLAGKGAMDLAQWPQVQLATLSAHKFHGPKGMGALFVRRGARIVPQMPGLQQGRRRGGTENVPGIVGMGLAAEIAKAELPHTIAHCAGLRDQLAEGLARRIDVGVIHAGHAPRLCNTLSIGFPGLQAEAIVLLLSERGICISAGSACHSGSLEPSYVLSAMGVPQAIAHGTVRLSLSRLSTQSDVDAVLEVLPEVVARLGKLHGLSRAVNILGGTRVA